MGQKSVYLEKLTLNMVYGNTAKPAWATIYFALFLTSPSAGNDAGVEPSGGSYARAAITNNATNFPNATQTGTDPASKKNVIAITWPVPTTAWGDIVAFGVYDALTAGNLLGWAEISPAKSIVIGHTYTISANGIIFTEK